MSMLMDTLNLITQQSTTLQKMEARIKDLESHVVNKDAEIEKLKEESKDACNETGES